MRLRFVLALFLTTGTLAERPAQSQSPSMVRIGLTQNATTVTIRGASAFTIQQNRTRTAKFTSVLALDPAASGTLTPANLQYRTLVEVDGGKLIALPKGVRTQIEATSGTLEFENRTYRGKIEVF